MRTLFLFIILSVILFPAYGQTRDEMMDSFNEGLYFLNRGDYKEAAFYFRKVVDKYPDNANYNFKLGECYMNIPGSEAWLFPVLKKPLNRSCQKKNTIKRILTKNLLPCMPGFTWEMYIA